MSAAKCGTGIAMELEAPDFAPLNSGYLLVIKCLPRGDYTR